ncbi:hypothetical protein DUNSADRAFT_1787 [Dunaliella salina]|uniref:RecQ-mediated genome instability protein 1 n=1 Tax=Dunaliella salina TaxID=3046 RepID=A0ABQ7GWL9_DUNSA|nr:hypothetical protein DUNSADRAFT_1787 [Dunaliella salina]|eukprot:KAF5839010.1 hypothetical protein DUNSADRAFT_1787 [Dunaliella salina]
MDAVMSQLAGLGVFLQPNWVHGCVDQLRSSRPSEWTALSAQPDMLVEAVLGHVLLADFRECGAAHLPLGMNAWHNQMLQGKHVVQLDEVVDMGAPARERYMPKTGPRCLKLHLTDGHQQVIGIEFRTIPALSWDCPAGTKVVLENVNVKRGVLMLQPENLAALGGLVESLEAARKRAIEVWNLPPSGRSQRDGPRDILGEAQAAARRAAPGGAPVPQGLLAVPPPPQPAPHHPPIVPSSNQLPPAAWSGSGPRPMGIQPHPAAGLVGASNSAGASSSAASAATTAAGGRVQGQGAAAGHFFLGAAGAGAGPLHGGTDEGLRMGASGGGLQSGHDFQQTGSHVLHGVPSLPSNYVVQQPLQHQQQQQQQQQQGMGTGSFSHLQPRPHPPSFPPHPLHALQRQQQQQQQPTHSASNLHDGGAGMWEEEDADMDDGRCSDDELMRELDNEPPAQPSVPQRGPPVAQAAAGPTRPTGATQLQAAPAAPSRAVDNSPPAAQAAAGSAFSCGRGAGAAAAVAAAAAAASAAGSRHATMHSAHANTAPGGVSPRDRRVSVSPPAASGGIGMGAAAPGRVCSLPLQSSSAEKRRQQDLMLVQQQQQWEQREGVAPKCRRLLWQEDIAEPTQDQLTSFDHHPPHHAHPQQLQQQQQQQPEPLQVLLQGLPRLRQPNNGDGDSAHAQQQQQQQHSSLLHNFHQQHPQHEPQQRSPPLKHPQKQQKQQQQQQQQQQKRRPKPSRLPSHSSHSKSTEVIELQDSSEDDECAVVLHPPPQSGQRLANGAASIASNPDIHPQLLEQQQTPQPRQVLPPALPPHCVPATQTQEQLETRQQLSALNTQQLNTQQQLVMQPPSYPLDRQQINTQQQLGQQSQQQLGQQSQHSDLDLKPGHHRNPIVLLPPSQTAVDSQSFHTPPTLQELQGCAATSAQGLGDGASGQGGVVPPSIGAGHPVGLPDGGVQGCQGGLGVAGGNWQTGNGDAVGGLESYRQHLEVGIQGLGADNGRVAGVGLKARGVAQAGCMPSAPASAAAPSALQPPGLVFPQAQALVTPPPPPAKNNNPPSGVPTSLPTTSSSALSLTSRSASSASGAVAGPGQEGREDVGPVDARGRGLGVGQRAASEWESAPVVHLCMLRYYQMQLASQIGGLPSTQGMGTPWLGGTGSGGCSKGLRVRVLGGIHAVVGQMAKVEDGTGLQEMEMSDHMMTHSLGFGLQAAEKLRCYNAHMLQGNPAEHAQLAARAQESSAFLKNFHGLLLIELPFPSTSPSSLAELPLSKGLAAGSNAAAILGGIHPEGGLPRLMGLQVVEGGAKGLRRLMVQARENWHAAIGSAGQR